MTENVQDATDDTSGYFDEEIATFGDRIVAARDAMGLNRSQLAARLGVKSATLANWEDDRAEPRANKLQMLAGVLNVSMVWLMTGAGEGVAVSGDDPAEAHDLLADLRSIRTEQVRLGERLARLEKRLRARLS